MNNSPKPIRTHDLTVDMLRQLANTRRLYAIVDACNAPLVPRKVMELGPSKAVSLYRGTAEEQYWDVAPYLLSVDELLLDWILSAKTKGPWGVFAACHSELESVRHHFRHFLRVQLPDGSNSLFRFYDPRVLKPFLESCSDDHLQLFFGPIFAFGTIDLIQASGVFYYRRSVEQVLPAAPPVYPLAFPLTEEHIAALKPQADLAKVEELIDFLRETNNEWIKDIPDDVLRKRVLAGLLRARKYGFTRMSNISFFVASMFNIGAAFDEQPNIHAALTDPNVHPDLRVNRMFDRTTDGDWEEAHSCRCEESWQGVCAAEGVKDGR